MLRRLLTDSASSQSVKLLPEIDEASDHPEVAPDSD